jgi:hypothetical protein
MNELRMIIMATDEKNYPRFGQDGVYSIRYVGPDKIEIDGPDRLNMVYLRAHEGIEVNFDKSVEQTN